MMRISSADQHEDVGYRIGVEFGGRWWLLAAFEERGGELGEMSKKRVSPFLWAVLLRGCFFLVGEAYDVPPSITSSHLI
jgi:hypothetical protein